MEHWYVIQTKPQSEEHVCRLLALAHIETYLPKVEHYLRLRGAPHFRPGPLFPSYCFCKMDLDHANTYHMIRYTRGVHQFLGRPLPTPISDDIIDTLKEKIDTHNMAEIIPFKPGHRFKVKRGLLKDLEGILDRPMTADGRIHVLLNLVNHQMKATLHWSEVERVRAS